MGVIWEARGNVRWKEGRYRYAREPCPENAGGKFMYRIGASMTCFLVKENGNRIDFSAHCVCSIRPALEKRMLQNI